MAAKSAVTKTAAKLTRAAKRELARQKMQQVIQSRIPPVTRTTTPAPVEAVPKAATAATPVAAAQAATPVTQAATSITRTAPATGNIGRFIIPGILSGSGLAGLLGFYLGSRKAQNVGGMETQQQQQPPSTYTPIPPQPSISLPGSRIATRPMQAAPVQAAPVGGAAPVQTAPVGGGAAQPPVQLSPEQINALTNIGLGTALAAHTASMAGQGMQQPQATPTPMQPDRIAGLAALLGQLGQAITAREPESFGYQLGGIATRAAQARLYNQYLARLIGGAGSEQAPNFPEVSSLESFGLAPELQSSAIGQLESSRSGDIDRLYKLGLLANMETPEQQFRRQLITSMLSNSGRELQLVRGVNLDSQGRPTKGADKHIWWADKTTGEPVRYFGPDYEVDRSGTSGLAAQQRWLAADKDARQYALQRLASRYTKGEVTFDPITKQYNVGFVPPGSQFEQDFLNEYANRARFLIRQGMLPQNWLESQGLAEQQSQKLPNPGFGK